tara:strand:+ start:17458 stop:18006 length:549 start_codon:yes stop_codon:yes gene_type:complete
LLAVWEDGPEKDLALEYAKAHTSNFFRKLENLASNCRFEDFENVTTHLKQGPPALGALFTRMNEGIEGSCDEEVASYEFEVRREELADEFLRSNLSEEELEQLMADHESHFDALWDWDLDEQYEIYDRAYEEVKDYFLDGCLRVLVGEFSHLTELERHFLPTKSILGDCMVRWFEEAYPEKE